MSKKLAASAARHRQSAAQSVVITGSEKDVAELVKSVTSPGKGRDIFEIELIVPRSKTSIGKGLRGTLKRRARVGSAQGLKPDVSGPVVTFQAKSMILNAGFGGKPPKAAATTAQGKEILARIETWAGSRAAALRWYRSQPIAALGDQTAEGLVRTGQADLVRSYLDGIAAGGYA